MSTESPTTFSMLDYARERDLRLRKERETLRTRALFLVLCNLVLAILAPELPWFFCVLGGTLPFILLTDLFRLFHYRKLCAWPWELAVYGAFKTRETSIFVRNWAPDADLDFHRGATEAALGYPEPTANLWEPMDATKRRKDGWKKLRNPDGEGLLSIQAAIGRAAHARAEETPMPAELREALDAQASHLPLSTYLKSGRYVISTEDRKTLSFRS